MYLRFAPIGKSDQPFRSDKENSDNESSRPRDRVCNGRIPLRSVSSSGAKGNSGAGITLEQGSSNNQITNMSSAGNGGTSDLIDNNPRCDWNLWFNNAFGD